MHAKLVVVEPVTQPNEYQVTLPLTIGRGREAGLQLQHALISRQHCELFEDRGRIMVRDLSSLNGTFIGGQRVETAPLLSGQLLTIGSVTLRAVYGEDAILATPENALEGMGSVETVSMEETAEATYDTEDDDTAEPLGFDDSRGNYFKPSDN